MAFVVLISQKGMNPNASSCRTLAFTLVEMLTVIAIISILAALLLPVLDKSEARGKRIVCVNGLEQAGLAFHTFSNDHDGKFPMAISTNDGGSMEYVQSGFQSGDIFYTSFRNFQTLSSLLVFPQTLICPADLRVAATNFPSLQNQNLSYFVGVESTFDKPTSILAGDRNLVTNSFDQPTILGFGQLSRLGWTWELHQFKGNVLFADGHVEQWNNSSLSTGEGSSPFDQSFFMPSVPPGTELQIASGPPGSGGSSSTGPSGPGPSGSSGSGSPPAYPTSTSSQQPEPAPSPSGNDASSSTASGQPMQSMSGSSGERMYVTQTLSQAQAPDHLVAVTQPPASDETDAVVSVPDPNAGMSQFDRHMTMVMQNSLVWLYILLCILVLLYFLYRMQKRMRERQARRRGQFPNSDD